MITNKFIVISGVDGSGKTTKAKAIQQYLTSMGVNVTYVWFRWNAYLSYLPLLLAKIAKLTIFKRINDNVVIVRRYYKCKPLSYLWIITQTIDFIIAHLLSLLHARILSKTSVVIYDRFAVPDKLIDLMYETHVNVLRIPLTKALIYWFLKNLRKGRFILVYMKVSPQTVLRRRSDLPSKSYPYVYVTLYNSLTTLLIDEKNTLVLYGDRDLRENLIKTIAFINEKLLSYYKGAEK